VANDAASLEAARQLTPGQGVDFVELRLDAFAHQDQLDALREAVPALSLPLLITARHPAEGGHGNLSAERRLELYHAFLPQAGLLDLELRSSTELPEIISQARHQDKLVVLSFHDFHGTPRVELLEDLATEALQRGAHIFKVATTVNDLTALNRLIRFAERGNKALPHGLALMGMGKYGKVSRLLLAQHGSVLNYGSLGGTPVPGQWDARQMAERLAELR
jgi:3-dehydroquinate dehydratase-1